MKRGALLMLIGLSLGLSGYHSTSSAQVQFSVTAGGWIPGAAGVDKASFGVSAMINGDGSVTGHLIYLDHSVGLLVESSTITSVVSEGCASEVSGVTDAGDAFVLTLGDNGEAGMGIDSFTIQIVGAGVGAYSNSGFLAGGNVQVHGSSCPRAG